MPRGWFAYSLARLLNQLAWKLEHALFIGHGGWGEVLHNNRDVIAGIRALFPDVRAAELEIEATSVLERWWDIVASENFVDSANATADHYVDLARRGGSSHDIDDYFTDNTGLGTSTVERIRSAVLREGRLDSYLTKAYLLGELVDRGVRPPDRVKYECFDFWTLSPFYWEVKRSAEFREASFEYREAWRSYRLVSEMESAEDDEDRPIAPPPRPGRPWLPRRYRLECRSYPNRRSALDLRWGPDVRIAWRDMDMPGDPPLAIYAYHKRPNFRAYEALMAQIDAAAIAGFSALEGLSETRTTTLVDPKSALVGSCPIPIVGTTGEHPSNRLALRQSNPTKAWPRSDGYRESVSPAGLSADSPHRDGQSDLRPPVKRPKKPPISKSERSRLLKKYLEGNEFALIDEVVAATGCSKGAISGDPLWKAHLKGRRQKLPTRYRERNVKPGKMDFFPAHTNDAAEIELYDEIEQGYQNSRHEDDISAYNKATKSRRKKILLDYVEACKDTLTRFCADSKNGDLVASYNDILEKGDLKTILFSADQIINGNAD